MELKPCPFCGGEAETWLKANENGHFVFVQCHICKAQTPVKTAVQFDDDDDDEFWEQRAVFEVESLWNTRVPTTVSQNSGNR